MSGLQLLGGPGEPLVSRETALILGGARIGLCPDAAHTALGAWPEQILPARLLGTAAASWQEVWQCPHPCRAGQHDGLVQTMAKSTVRTVGNSLGKEILRGVLGGILGNKKR